jgi:pilus assembly protein CpaB
MLREKWIIAVSLALGLAAGGVYFLYAGGAGIFGGKQPAAQPAQSLKTKKCVVAATDVPVRTKLTPEMLGTIDAPESMAHPQSIADANKAVGRITRDRLVKGQMILEPNLKDENTPSELSFILPAGMRAVTIGASVTTGVGNMLSPGDYIDVIVFLDSNIADKGVSFTLLSKVLVLATDTRLEGGEQQSSAVGKVTGSMESAKGYDSVTLAVSPEDCVKLNLADSIGKLKLALHSPNDPLTKPNRLELTDPRKLAAAYGFGVTEKNGTPANAPQSAAATAATPKTASDAQADRTRTKTDSEHEVAKGKPRTIYILKGSELQSMTAAPIIADGGTAAGKDGVK